MGLDSALSRLRHQWKLLWVLAAGGVGSGVVFLTGAWGAKPAARWGVQAGLALAYSLVRLGKNLGLNHGPGDQRLLASLGPANALTCLRACLVAALAGFLFQTPAAGGDRTMLAWAPGVIYLCAAALDFADGFVARMTGQETRLGEWLDTEVDALGLLVASLLLVWSGKAPAAYLSVGLGYYAIRAAIRLRRLANRPVGEIPPRPAARLVAGCEMGFAAAALMPVFGAEATAPAAWVMTLAILASLGQDWIIVCNYTKISGPMCKAGVDACKRILARALPLALRAAVAAGMITTLAAWPERVLPAAFPDGVKACIGVAAALCVLGVAARAAAVVLSLLDAAWLFPSVPGIGPAVALVAAVGILMTGAGHPRLWQPEDRFLLGKHGRKKETRSGELARP